LIWIDEPVPAGIDKFDVSPVNEQRNRNPIARDARRVLNNADALAAQAIEQAAFPDVGPAHDRDEGHGWHK